MTPTLESIKAKLYTTNEYGVSYQNPDARLDPEEIEWLNERYGIRTDWHPTCIGCQARQLIKYDGFKNKKGEPVVGFKVPCHGIVRSLPAEAVEARDRLVTERNMDRGRATQILLATVDPVAWAELMFGFSDSQPNWRLRSYQKEQLRCSSKRIVIREGRRSGKTFVSALKLLYMALNRRVPNGFNDQGEQLWRGPEIMIVTPYQSQILNIFDEMEGLLKKNKDLRARCTTGSGGSLYVKTPFFHMDFENGAVIKGFVSGVGTKLDGSGGGTMRGQNGSIIYLDEMDMIPDEVLDKVILPILLTDQEGEVVLISTSTPIGKRARFYQWCKEDPTFKEDHLPSTILPQWDKMKNMLETEGTQETFRSEYMAEFIDGGHGVFRPSYVLGPRVQKDYRYEDIWTRENWWSTAAGVIDKARLTVCIGIDWNKNAGTEFCVVAYDAGNDRYIVCETLNVPASEFSARDWKATVIRLNYKWKPNYIYADEGYGHTIIEELKLRAHELKANPQSLMDVESSKLAERLKSFNFSGRVELRNPLDGLPMTKSGKDYLVENAVRAFEYGQVWYSLYDKVLKDQLLNYVVLRRSPTTNKPVYGPESETIADHRLDAFMLALAGLKLEIGEFSPQAALPFSKPGHLSDTTLKERVTNKDPLGLGAMLDRLKQGIRVPANIDVVKIRRSGESEADTIARLEEALAPESRVHARSRGRTKTEQGMSVHEYFTSTAVDSRGYSTDTEHLYKRKVEEVSSHVVVPRRRR